MFGRAGYSRRRASGLLRNPSHGGFTRKYSKIRQKKQNFIQLYYSSIFWSIKNLSLNPDGDPDTPEYGSETLYKI
jgi:hypothetical protein